MDRQPEVDLGPQGQVRPVGFHLRQPAKGGPHPVPDRVGRRLRREAVRGAVAERSLHDDPLRPGQDRSDLIGQRVVAGDQRHRDPVVPQANRVDGGLVVGRVVHPDAATTADE